MPKCKPAEELTKPGWFDVGAGFGMTTKGKNSSGYFLSVKAYPQGRWYAFEKTKKQEATEDAQKAREQAATKEADLSSRKLDLASAKVTALESKKAEEEALEALAAKQGQSADAAYALLLDGQAGDGWPNDELVLLQAYQTKAQEAATAEVDLKTAEDKLAEAQKASDDADQEALQATSNALMDALDEVNQNVYAIDGHSFWQRFSVSLSTSVLGGFDRDGPDLASEIQGDLWALGLSFDVAPQFALHAGYGILKIDGAEDDETAFFGVSLNTNAFRALFGEVSGGGES